MFAPLLPCFVLGGWVWLIWFYTPILGIMSIDALRTFVKNLWGCHTHWAKGQGVGSGSRCQTRWPLLLFLGKGLLGGPGNYVALAPMVAWADFEPQKEAFHWPEQIFWEACKPKPAGPLKVQYILLHLWFYSLYFWEDSPKWHELQTPSNLDPPRPELLPSLTGRTPPSLFLGHLFFPKCSFKGQVSWSWASPSSVTLIVTFWTSKPCSAGR